MTDFVTAQTAWMNDVIAAGVDFCSQGADLIATHTAQQSYDQENPFNWFWTLSRSNRSVFDQLVETMMQSLWDAGADDDCPELDPLNDQQGFVDWYEENKSNPDRKSCHKAFAYGCRLMLGQENELSSEVKKAYAPIIFASAYVSSMNDVTGQDEAEIRASLKSWFVSQVTFDQFSAGGTYT